MNEKGERPSDGVIWLQQLAADRSSDDDDIGGGDGNGDKVRGAPLKLFRIPGTSSNLRAMEQKRQESE